jgi:hypothetical protein
VRLVRLGPQPSRVAEDIRAALASLGRGNHVVGGIALVGPKPLLAAKPVDAFVLLPGGLLIVIGVDLPDPAMLLEAPLDGQWKADGWPLIGPDNAVNPAAGALALAESLRRQLRQKAPESLPIGTILAAGPFVEKVEQPPSDLAGGTRVLHPTPTSMLAATVSLTSATKPCTVDQARTLLGMLAPEASRLSAEVLTGEGFADQPAEPETPLATATVTVPLTPPNPSVSSVPAVSSVSSVLAPSTSSVPPASASSVPPSTASSTPSSAPPASLSVPPLGAPAASPTGPNMVPPPPRPAALPKPIEVTAPVPKILIPIRPEKQTRIVRWLPMAAIGLLAVIVVAAIVLATTSGTDNASPPVSTPAPPTPVAQVVQGLQFSERAAATESQCANHAYGDVQVSLQQAACATMRRASFETSVSGRLVAVSIAVLYFGDEATATAFKRTADTPGSGGMTDLATETGKWPQPVQFAGSAYASAITGTAVRLVLAVWFDGTSSPTDPALTQVARSALSVQLN